MLLFWSLEIILKKYTYFSKKDFHVTDKISGYISGCSKWYNTLIHMSMYDKHLVCSKCVTN